VRATCPVYLILLDLTILYFGNSTSYEDPHYVFFYSLPNITTVIKSHGIRWAVDVFQMEKILAGNPQNERQHGAN
jgi:hypothetical protein